jgi:hypothetical protein
LLIAIVKYNTVIYKNNVINILNKFKKNHQFNNIYRVIVNRVRLYKNRSTVQFDLQSFVSDGKTGHLRKVCNNMYTNIFV